MPHTAPNETVLLLVERGKCDFTEKANYAQRAGAAAVIVVDSEIEHVDDVIMGDDGYGYRVKIPSIFISTQDGE